MSLPPVRDQADHLISLGIHQRAGLSAKWLRETTSRSSAEGLLVIRHDLAPASVLAAAITVAGRQGFVVSDMSDVDEFTPISSIRIPSSPVFIVRDLDRGDAMSNWSPDEALPAIADAGRTPLTLTEGLHWVLQWPEVLERGH